MEAIRLLWPRSLWQLRLGGRELRASHEPDLHRPEWPPQLQSWDSTESDTGHDTQKLFISTNGGSSWTEIDQVVTNGGNWESRTVSLASYAGLNASLAFATGDRAYNNFEGWYVDDVTVV